MPPSLGRREVNITTGGAIRVYWCNDLVVLRLVCNRENRSELSILVFIMTSAELLTYAIINKLEWLTRFLEKDGGRSCMRMRMSMSMSIREKITKVMWISDQF